MEDKSDYSVPDNITDKIYYFHQYMNETQFYPHHSSGSYIRLCIFLITSVCVGLPALVWAFRLLHLHRKNRGQISAFIVLLLLSDLIELLLDVSTVTVQFIEDTYWHLFIDIFSLSSWPVLSLCGFHLHQLVALEGALRLKYPLFSAHVFACPCYTIISILVIVFSISGGFFFLNVPFANNFRLLFSLGTSLTSLCLLAVTFTITCKAPPTPVSKSTRSVFTVAILTFVMLYLPFMLVICVRLFTMGDFTMGVHPSLTLMSVCLMSLRVISDPLLCVLVCRENLRDVQTPQTHTEPNDDETSV